jgi:hypothetical protein
MTSGKGKNTQLQRPRVPTRAPPSHIQIYDGEDVISVRYHPPLSPSLPDLEIIIAYTLQIQAITVLKPLTICIHTATI